MIIHTVIVIAILGVWMLLSILGQLERAKIGKWARRMDPASLIPRWSFFAPNPGVTDFHLLYRDKMDNSELSYWKEYPLASPKSMTNAIWNPRKRNPKALSDLVQALIRAFDTVSPAGFKTTFPYLALLNFIVNLPREHYAVSTQFIIMESYGFYSDKEPKVIFRSEFHKI